MHDFFACIVWGLHGGSLLLMKIKFCLRLVGGRDFEGRHVALHVCNTQMHAVVGI
jgi:hypothetical protein